MWKLRSSLTRIAIDCFDELARLRAVSWNSSNRTELREVNRCNFRLILTPWIAMPSSESVRKFTTKQTIREVLHWRIVRVQCDRTGRLDEKARSNVWKVMRKFEPRAWSRNKGSLRRKQACGLAVRSAQIRIDNVSYGWTCCTTKMRSAPSCSMCGFNSFFNLPPLFFHLILSFC